MTRTPYSSRKPHSSRTPCSSWKPHSSRTPRSPWRLLLVAALAGAGACHTPDYDVVIVGGTIYDGSGGAPFVADVGINDGMIEAIGDLASATAFEAIDATGLVVAPGFIDAHSHAELDEPWGRDAESFLTQGITTVTLGLDGFGAFAVDSVLGGWSEFGIGVNALYFVGHNAVRRHVMGNEPRAPTDAELDSMKALVRRGMEEGAFGLSTGLFYTPGTFSATEEVVELAKVAAEWEGAIYDTHDRDLGATLGGIGYDASVAEAIHIAEESGLRGIFSHFNPQGATNYGRADVGARMIEEARARGVEMYAAHHPYTATQSNLRSYALPRWSSSGSTDEVLARFENPDTVDFLHEQILESLAMRGGAEKILIVEEDERLNGRTLAQLAEEWGQSVPETVRTVIAEWGNASVMNLDLYDIENTRTLARMPWMMTCTDGRTPAPGQQVGHPRAAGAFPRKMRLFALEGGDIDVAFTIRSFSGLAADFFGLTDRGYVEEGRRADVVVLDLERYRDLATMEEPRLLSQGVVHTLVNGRFAIRDGDFLGVLAGEALRAPWEHPES